METDQQVCTSLFESFEYFFVARYEIVDIEITIENFRHCERIAWLNAQCLELHFYNFSLLQMFLSRKQELHYNWILSE